MLTHMDFEQIFFIFLKPVKTHLGDHYVLPIWSMGVMAEKYGVSVSICCKLEIFGKTNSYGF
jgi:hypothetical protein